ncbi:right-handed parallel beta-helix repeat-containing protein [Haloarchaeobius sp. DFWS5]|uniref:right-handed parallel beta-helix repeat-containing protein n=1 Tax=Haloarchaeobius sp. DFWS5 TaxID=3446114 RepID=UPI003EB7649C
MVTKGGWGHRQSGVSTAILLLTLALTVAAATGPAAATGAGDVITVDAGGNGDYTTIQAAVDNASPGDTILVEDGTYDSFLLNKDITVKAASGANPTVTGDGAAVIQIEQRNGGDPTGATVDGLTLSGSATLGVEVRADDVHLCDLTISVGTTGVQAQGDSVNGDDVEGLTIEDVSTDGGAVGVSLTAGTNATVDGLTVTDATTEGVGLGTTDVTFSDVSVTGATDSVPGIRFYGVTPTDGGSEAAAVTDILDTNPGVGAVDVQQTGHVYDRSVSANGTYYHSAQAAADAASAGDTITVSGAVGPMVLDEPVTVVGEGDATVDANGATAGITLASSNVTVQDLTVTGASQGLLVDSEVADITVTNVTATGNNNGFSFWNAADASDVTFTDVNFSENGLSNGGAGLDFASTAQVRDLTIDGGQFDRNGYFGIEFTTNGKTGVLDGLDVTGATFVDNGEAAGQASRSQAVYVETLSDATFDGVTVAGSEYGFNINLKNGSYENVAIRGSDVSKSGSSWAPALYVQPQPPSYDHAPPATLDGLTIENNTIESDTYGLAVQWNSTAVTIADNIIQNSNIGYANWVTDASEVDASGNTFQNNDLHFHEQTDALASDLLANNDFDGHIDVSDATTPHPGSYVWGDLDSAVEMANESATITLAPGTYPTNVTVDKSLTIEGPNAGTHGNATRDTEAVLVPEDKNQSVVVDVTATDVTVRGLTFDGNNPAVTSGVDVGGVDADAGSAIWYYQDAQQDLNLTVEDNVVRNVQWYGVMLYNGNSGVSNGNVVDDNLVENVDMVGILLYNNAYADVTDNVVTGVGAGIQTGNYHKAGGPARIANNDISAEAIGIYHNLQYSQASEFSIVDNDIGPLANGTGRTGIELSSLGVDATVTGNDIAGTEEGIVAWNTEKSADVTVSGGSITDVETGVIARNYNRFGDADGSYVTIDGVTIDALNTGILVNDSIAVDETDSSTDVAHVNVTGGTTIDGCEYGLVLWGANASADFQNGGAVDFSDHVPTIVDVRPNADESGISGSFDLWNASIEGTPISELSSAEIGALTGMPVVADGVAYTSFEDAKTAAPNAQEFAISLTVPGDGQPHAVGFPGPVDTTVGEAFGDFDGVVWAYDAANDTWARPEAGDDIGALDAMVVVAEEETSVTVSFENAGTTPGAPGERELHAGWNFVAAPQGGDVGPALGASTADISRVIDVYADPTGLPISSPDDFDRVEFTSSAGENVSAFTGYWVYANEDGSLAMNAYEGVTADDLYELLKDDDDE